MNKIAQGLIGATAAILLLAGCSAVSAEAQGVPSVAPSVSATPSSEPSTSGPVTVTPSPTATPTSGVIPDGEAAFVKAMHGEVTNQGLEGVSDADLLKAGYYACELFAQGQTYDKMDVIQGDAPADAARHDRDIASLASQALCVQYDISK